MSEAVVTDEQNPVVGLLPPICAECKTKESAFWHRSSNNDFVCTVCHENRQDGSVTRTLRSQSNTSIAVTNSTPKISEETESLPIGPSRTNLINTTRKSNRMKPLNKARAVQSVTKSSVTKGRSRKSVLKKNPLKAPVAVSTIVPSDYIFFEGNYWQVGDVVSVKDEDDECVYYAQLRGFLQDQYCNKSAVITWLIPTAITDEQNHYDHLSSEFDPKLYVAGPEEDLPRDMTHFEFICHAPSDYFSHHTSYCSRVLNPPAFRCIWTRSGPEVQGHYSLLDSDDATSHLNDAEAFRNDGDREVNRRATSLNRGGGMNKAQPVVNNRFKDKVNK